MTDTQMTGTTQDKKHSSGLGRQSVFRAGKFLGVSCAVMMVMGLPSIAQAYQLYSTGRWNSTSQTASAPNQGDPITLSWGFMTDGSPIPVSGITTTESSDPSSLISFFDGLYGNGVGGSDLTTRPWFSLFDSSYERWASVSGLSFEYEPADDGVARSSQNSGIDGVRADLRIGAHFIGSTFSTNLLAYNYRPSYGDMVIDTSDSGFFGNPANNSLRARNVITHEAGHGIGLAHEEIDAGNHLMNPSINLNFDGPQLDDIQGAQRMYGDTWEKNGGNDTFGTATPLGPVTDGMTVSVGTDSDNLAVAYTDTDFFSIDDESDTDFFSITIIEDGELSLILTPKGPTYRIDGTASFDSSSQNDLTLSLFDSDGTSLLSFANLLGLGGTESILDFALASGTYFAQIAGLTTDTLQLYQLDASFTAVPEPTSLVLLGMGAMLFAGHQRRNRQTVSDTVSSLPRV